MRISTFKDLIINFFTAMKFQEMQIIWKIKLPNFLQMVLIPQWAYYCIQENLK